MRTPTSEHDEVVVVMNYIVPKNKNVICDRVDFPAGEIVSGSTLFFGQVLIKSVIQAVVYC